MTSEKEEGKLHEFSEGIGGGDTEQAEQIF